MSLYALTALSQSDGCCSTHHCLHCKTCYETVTKMIYHNIYQLLVKLATDINKFCGRHYDGVCRVTDRVGCSTVMTIRVCYSQPQQPQHFQQNGFASSFNFTPVTKILTLQLLDCTLTGLHHSGSAVNKLMIFEAQMCNSNNFSGKSINSTLPTLQVMREQKQDDCASNVKQLAQSDDL